ncbi:MULTISPECIES: hypothetical protein [Acidiphilium]|uniref:Uncharacterized protein n=1 Tax=Acidiphilium rubrum TaxID=526 RepID=A0A8G2FI31_ACIRU|nr:MULTISPECIES: hypothetical protein [Acidiphilium]SIR47076.1 hypothetical protein SAMN05421828_13611 [Acidiphilium rubrum]
MALDGTKPAGLGHRWTEAEDRILYEGFLFNETPRIISVRCGRSLSAIRQRLIRLDLIDGQGVRNNNPPLFDQIRATFHAKAVSGGGEPAAETDS